MDPVVSALVGGAVTLLLAKVLFSRAAEDRKTDAELKKKILEQLEKIDKQVVMHQVEVGTIRQALEMGNRKFDRNDEFHANLNQRLHEVEAVLKYRGKA